MNQKEISDKEFAIIREISNNHLPDQRTIAIKTGFSLGLTNLIIKRLIKKGYLKAKQLNRRKIQYILTPKGFAEKAKKSYNFVLKTVNLFKTVKEHIQKLINSELNNGIKHFIIFGNNELADITEIAIHSLSNSEITFTRIDSLSKLKIDNTTKIILTDGKNLILNNAIDLLSYLAELGLWIN